MDSPHIIPAVKGHYLEEPKTAAGYDHQNDSSVFTLSSNDSMTQLEQFQHQHLQQHQHLILQHDQFSRPKDPVQRHRQPDLPVPPPPYSQPTLKYTKSMPILTSGISSKSWFLTTNDGADESWPFSTMDHRVFRFATRGQCIKGKKLDCFEHNHVFCNVLALLKERRGGPLSED